MSLPPMAQLAEVTLKAVGIYGAIILYTRLAGLRSFSKISGFDFAMTVAIGSCISTTVLSSGLSLVEGFVGVGMIYMLQACVSKLRRFEWVRRLVDNRPLLVAYRGDVLEENFRKADISINDLRAKLREANVLTLDEVEAVVCETTGDVSVLHAEETEANVRDWLLEDVRGLEAIDSFQSPPSSSSGSRSLEQSGDEGDGKEDEQADE